MTFPFIAARGNRGGTFAAAAAAPAAEETAQVTQQDYLANWWKLDENSGTTAADSGNGNTAGLNFVNVPTWAVGVNGSCLSLDGSDDSLASDAFDLTPTTAFSFSYWLKNPGSDTTKYLEGAPWQAGGDYAASVAEPAFMMYAHLSAAIFYAKIKIDGIAASQVSAVILADVTDWNLWTLTWESGAAPKLYQNAALRATFGSTLTGTLDNATGDTFNFGKRLGGSTHWEILVDDIRIYSIALDIDDVTAIYNDGDGDFA